MRCLIYNVLRQRRILLDLRTGQCLFRGNSRLSLTLHGEVLRNLRVSVSLINVRDRVSPRGNGNPLVRLEIKAMFKI